MKLTYQEVKELLADTHIEGRSMICQFKVPGADRVIEAKSVIRKEASLKSQVADTVKRNFLYSARRMAFKTIRSVLGGYNLAGRVGSSVAGSLLSQAQQGMTFSAGEKERAVMEAFETVAGQFHYDTNTGTWLKADDVSEFERQLVNHPITDDFFRDVLARMIVQLAMADGELSAEETEYLRDQLGLSTLAIDELSLSEPVVMGAELAEAPEGMKETMYMLAFMAALVDERLHDSEKEMLAGYAQMFGFPDRVADRLALVAKKYLIQKSLTLFTSRKELWQLAEKLQMDRKEAEREMVRFRRKNYANP